MRPAGQAVVRLPLALLAIMMVAAPAPASAPEPAEPAEAALEAADRGLYIEPGADADEPAISAAVSAARRNGSRFAAIVLASSPPGGATTFADAVLDRIEDGTVVVLAPGELGYASFEYSQATLDRAADASLDDFRRDPAAGFAEFVETLGPVSAGGPAAGPVAEPAPSGGGVPWTLVIVGGLLLFVALGTGLSQKRRDRRALASHMATARDEVRRQVGVMADGILELADRVTVANNPQAEQHFATASEGYRVALDEVDPATTLGDLERINDRLDGARWELEAAAALVEGRPLPEKPILATASTACFFDPTHGAGTERATLRTQAGDREVRVCRACDALLDRGEQPQPRTITVGGSPVPAAQAPRSYGGGGFSALDIFTVLTGRGRAVPFQWGTPRRQRGLGGFGSGGGGFGRTLGSGSRRSGSGGGSRRSRGSVGRSVTRRTPRSSTRSASRSRARGGRRL